MPSVISPPQSASPPSGGAVDADRQATDQHRNDKNHPYRHVGEIVEYVNSRPTPLAAYWYGRQDDDSDTFRRGVNCGGMTANDFGLHCAKYRAPFGGLGRSGFGAYHGKTGFDGFTHHRTVAACWLPVNFAELITPPFSPRIAALTSSFSLAT